MHKSPRRWTPLAAIFAAMLLAGGSPAIAQPGGGARDARSADPLQGSLPTLTNPLVYKVHAANERLELVVNTSRILTLDQKIPQVQVNNPDVVELHALSPNEVQLYARAAGVTQVNLWGENKQLYSIDVVVYGDAQRLTMILRSEFPTSSVKAIPLANGVLLSGYVEKPEHIMRITQIAEEFYPKVLNNMTVAGVQQVLLHVKVMEVSRTKLRTLGFDFGHVTADGNLIMSGASGLLTNAASSGPLSAASGTQIPVYAGANTFLANIVTNKAMFFGVLDALRQDNLAKILAEPSLVCISGRPATFLEGGQIPVPEPQGLGTVTFDYKPYGTQIDFVPIVLGNGRIRLEVRPSVSEIDTSTSVTVSGTTVPGLKNRMVETGVEMMAGQTLAIAGLLQTRDEAQNQGLPWLSDLPYIGAAFRNVTHTRNEVELLILVTPELIEAVDSDKVPPGGPGANSRAPTDTELYWKGQLEAPTCDSSACNGCPPAASLGPGATAVAPASYNSMPQNPGMNGLRQESVPAPQPATDPAGNPQNRYNPPRSNGQAPLSASAPVGNSPGLIGPVGYDLQ
jgi:pilus assembly protein CpaC